MKRLALLTILLVVLASCGGFKTHNHFIGERYAVVVPERVVVFSEPSLNSEPKLLERPEEFMIEGVECGEAKKDGVCPYEMDKNNNPKNIEELFYKIKFESGKMGYLNAAFFFYPELSRYFLGRGYGFYVGSGNTFEIKTDYNTMWNIVIDSIDDRGFVIAQMRKEDGYIAWRRKISVWFSRKNDGYIEIIVKAKADEFIENKSDKRDIPYWRETSDHYDERELLNTVREKFLDLKKSE